MPWTTIGTAIDHRLRLAFTSRALPGASREPAVSCNPITTGIQLAAASAAHHAARAGEPGCQDDANARQAGSSMGARRRSRPDACGQIGQMVARTSPHLNPHLALPDPDEARAGALAAATGWKGVAQSAFRPVSIAMRVSRGLRARGRPGDRAARWFAAFELGQVCW